jgi:hypothetical protein
VAWKGIDRFCSQKPFWNAYHDALCKKHPEAEAQCKKLASGGKAAMSVYYDARPHPYGEVVQEFRNHGFTDDDAEWAAAWLEAAGVA